MQGDECRDRPFLHSASDIFLQAAFFSSLSGASSASRPVDLDVCFDIATRGFLPGCASSQCVCDRRSASSRHFAQLPCAPSALGKRERLAAVVTAQEQMMVRDQTDANGAPVAIGARKPFERRSDILRWSARTKGHCRPSSGNRIRVYVGNIRPVCWSRRAWIEQMT